MNSPNNNLPNKPLNLITNQRFAGKLLSRFVAKGFRSSYALQNICKDYTSKITPIEIDNFWYKTHLTTADTSAKIEVVLNKLKHE